MGHSDYDPVAKERRPWNAGRKLGGKRALKAQQIWAIRFWLDREGRLRDRAMFDLAIDSSPTALISPIDGLFAITGLWNSDAENGAIHSIKLNGSTREPVSINPQPFAADLKMAWKSDETRPTQRPIISAGQALSEKTQYVRAIRGADQEMAEGRSETLGSNRVAAPDEDPARFREKNISEPLRLCRRPFCLSHTAMAVSFNMAK